MSNATEGKQEGSDFNIDAYAPVLATAYGEVANQGYDTKRRVLSTILNRAESGKKEFGADTGKITDVLQRGYYAYSKQSPKFKEGLSRKFPDKMSEDSFKEIYVLLSGMLQGKVQRSEDQFYITPKELKNTKMNMDLLEKTGQDKTYIYFKYKTPAAGKRQTSKKGKQ